MGPSRRPTTQPRLHGDTPPLQFQPTSSIVFGFELSNGIAFPPVLVNVAPTGDRSYQKKLLSNQKRSIHRLIPEGRSCPPSPRSTPLAYDRMPLPGRMQRESFERDKPG